MIKIGSKIGAFSTIALVLLTAVLGLYFARIQGIQTLKSGLTNLYQNKVPFYDLISGASIAFAAILLIVPGFFTDLIGFILLIPFTRNILLKITLKNKKFERKTEGGKTIEGEIVKKDKDEL
tara:strand:+ start:85 stop:450 length:366 start_codon:yes stop_codon:yes gene_type:complete